MNVIDATLTLELIEALKAARPYVRTFAESALSGNGGFEAVEALAKLDAALQSLVLAHRKGE